MKNEEILKRYKLSQHCQSNNDGECVWKNCLQLLDNEPITTGRHCPLDVRDSEITGWDGY